MQAKINLAKLLGSWHHVSQPIQQIAKKSQDRTSLALTRALARHGQYLHVAHLIWGILTGSFLLATTNPPGFGRALHGVMTMAKVEIQQRAFVEPRLKTVASKSRVSKAVVLGYAAILWNESQQAGAVEASESDILAWLDCDRYAKPEKALKWLVAAGFLVLLEEKNEENFYKISGNSFAVERTQFHIQRAVTAAKARYHSESKCSKHASSMLEECFEHASSMPNRITDKQSKRLNTKPLNPPLQLVSERDLATAITTKAATILTMQAGKGQDPETQESEKEAHGRIAVDLGREALALLKEKYPQWKMFTRSWYNAYKQGNQSKFERALVRELRATAKVLAQTNGHRAGSSDLAIG